MHLRKNNVNISKIPMKKTFVITLIAALLLSSFAFFNIASAAMPFELPTPHYFGPYPNYATSQLPTVTYNPDGSVASATGGIRKFIDSLAGLGPAGVNNLGNYIPVAVADTVTYSGADYYEIAVVEFKQKFHTDIPLTTLRGYVQISTSVVPGAHTPLTYLNGTAIRLPNGNLAFGVDIPRYLGPTIVADKDKPVRIKFYNLLPAGMGGELFLPTDTSVMGAGMGPTPMMDGEGNPMLNPDGSIMYEMYSQNRATLHLHGGNTPWISDGTAHQWITPAGEDTAYPKGVSVYNVPDMPDPGPGAMTFYYTNQQSARLLFYHDHSYGITRLNVYAGEAAGYIIRDQIEQALITAGIIPADEIPLVIQDKTFVPDNTVPYTNMWGTFASQLAFQDPTWSVTKYGGPGSLWYPHVYVPMQNPGDPGGMNLIGRWQYSPWFWPPFNPEHPPVPNPYYIGGPLYDPAYPFNDLEPPMNPGTPNPSMPGEAFMDTPIVNGVAYPYLNVSPKAYRFRILSAADDRAFNLQMYIADNTTLTWDGRANTEVKMVPATFNATFPATWPTDGREGGVPDPAYRGPEFIQIGNEAGFLPAPAVLPNQPVNWNWDQGTFDFAIVNQMTLMLAPAERADVIVDFSQYAGKTIILYNDSPAPVPAADPRLDYYTGHPDTEDSGGSPSTIAGYGSNIRTVMQIRVAAATPAAPYDVDALNAAFASTPTTEGAFEAAQKTTIVPQAAYSSAYNQTFPDTIGSIFSTSLTFSPIGGSSPVTIPLQSKSIHDEMGGTFDMEYGRMEVKMGVEIPRSSPMTQTTILYGFADPPVDLIRTSISGTQIGSLGDGTQIWRITHNGVDTHPMHWHMYDVQVINRVAWDNNIRMPDANELGWKDTVRINPLQDTYIALRPIVPDIPFDLPNNIRPLDPTMPLGAVLADSTAADLTGVGRIAQDPNGEMVDIINHNVNFGWEYTWHCHILAHEEMDAMRAVPIGVRPRAPSSLTATAVPGGVQLFWFDNSLSETQFTIERATNPGFTTALTTFVVGENIRTYYDTTANPSQSYYYRVKATNVIGDTWDYNNPNINEGASFPTITMESTPSNTASVVDTVVKRYDFGTTTSPLETGYTRVSTTTSYSAPAGYGWDSTGGLQSRDRGAPDNLRRDFVMSTTDRTFRVDLPNGIYQVSVIVGDQTTWHGTMEIYAEGTRKTSITTSSPAQFEQRTFTVTITDGQLNLLFHN
jgi:FtsP/CotA-like multicopper oxidase with cupredoxin domain